MSQPYKPPKLNLITRFFQVLYNVWAAVWFVGIYLLIFPLTFVFLQVKSLHRYVHSLNRLWAQLFFPIIGQPLQIRWEGRPDPAATYVFVANHFSYLDIAIGMGVVKNYFAYVGKSSVKNIPLLGYMFMKHHIMVDRSDKGSRSQSLVQGLRALERGRSVFLMPEGGILSKNIPQMLRPFKDGAFVMAIERQVPLVPITFINAYKIMPNRLLRWGIPRIVVHEPIETTGKTADDLEALKEEVYHIIQSTIDANR